MHGGGPRLKSLLNRVGKKGEFIQGMRVTDAETMEVVENGTGWSGQQGNRRPDKPARGKAVGLTGKDASFIRAKKLRMQRKDAPPGDVIDVGQVGEITSIDPSLISFRRRRLHPRDCSDRCR